MDEKKKFYLKWPINLIVYILLVVFLRIFAIPVILLIMGWNKKQQPDGPDGGYCLDRSRKRLARLLWALLYLLLAAGCGVVFFMGLGEDKSAWEIKDWAVEIVSGGGFLLFAGCCRSLRFLWTWARHIISTVLTRSWTFKGMGRHIIS